MKNKLLITSALLLGLAACGGGSESSAPKKETPVPNSKAQFSGDLSGLVTTAAGSESISGTATVTDKDAGEASFTPLADKETTYGTFSINEAGAWSFALNKAQSDVSNLRYAVESLTENITLTSADGSTTTLTITITGVNNYPATFAGDLTAEVTLSSGNASGKVLVTDLDPGEAVFQTSVSAQYGTFTITQGGNWAYDLNEAHEKFASWTSVSDSTTDEIALASADGATTKLVITIKGVDKPDNNDQQELIYLSEERLKLSKQAIAANNQVYVDAYQELITLANKELNKAIDPVTNKTVTPPSGDKHDYYSLSPYWHPEDPNKPEELPWIRKDGVYNSMANGPEFDYTRLKAMFASLETLSLAYYFSNEDKYLIKAKEIVEAWFINDETKMNPNVNYGQGVPGGEEGRMFGIIEFTSIGKVLTAVELLSKNSMWSESNKLAMNNWLTDYYLWLTTSDFGIGEGNTKNNHASNYDYQLVGIMLFLNKMDEATEIVDTAKTSRVAAQIESDGSQPHELARTKSVNYTVNNLWALVRLADLGRRHTDVDLWSFQTEEGVSLKAGFDFVTPYILGEKEWQWQQITGGGAESQLQNMAVPMFIRTELLLDEEIFPDSFNGEHNFDAKDILIYAP